MHNLKELKKGLLKFSPKTNTLSEPTLKKIAIFVDKAQNTEDLKSYSKFKVELLEQFYLIRSKGISFDFTDIDPYEVFSQLKEDFILNGKFRVFTGGENLPKNHPLSEKSKYGISYNLIFRAVHDVFGHLTEDYDFSFNGEYKAYKSHAAMFSQASQSALACETILQSIWVEYGPHKYKNGVFLGPTSVENTKIENIKFQPQKTYKVPFDILSII